MMRFKVPTAYYRLAKDAGLGTQIIVERIRKIRALNGNPKQVGISPDLAREFTTLRLKAGY